MVRISGRRPRRSEETDFRTMPVRIEDFERVAKFSERPVEDLQVEVFQIGIIHSQDRQQHLFSKCAAQVSSHGRVQILPAQDESVKEGWHELVRPVRGGLSEIIQLVKTGIPP